MAERFQPILQQTSASPFISPGVSDNSAATLISGLGKIGVEAYTGYQEAGLEKDIETTTQDYFTNQRQYEEGVQAGVDAGGLSKGIDSFWDKAATEAADVKDLSLLETQFKGKMETYASAMKQGKMTADQLYARIINTTREHVSRNPWLQKELLKTADDYLEITGLGGYIKTAQKSAKEEHDFQKKFIEERMTRADKLGLSPMTNRNWDTQLTEREAGVAKLESMGRGLQYVKDMLPEDAAKFLEGARPQVYPALWTNLQDTMISQMNAKQANGQPIPWEQQKYNIRREALQFKDKLRALVIQNNPRLMGEPSVKDFLSHTDQTVDELNKALDTFGSGEDALKFAQNQYNIVKAQQELQVAGLVNLPALQAAGVLMKDMPQGMQMRFMAEHPNAVNMMLSSTAMLLDGTVSPVNATYGVKAIEGMLAVGEKRPVPTELGKAITTMAATIKDPKSFPDLKTKINTQAQLVSQMANVAAKDQFAGMSPADRATATTVVAEYMDSAKALVEKNIKNLAEEGVLIGWGQLADGTLSLQYQEGSARNDTKLAELNAIYPGHLNNAIKAYSHLAGRTDYDKVFKDYFLGGDPALQGKEKAWEARTPDEAFNLFEAGTIDEPTYMAIIKDMKGKPRVTTTPDKSIPEVTSKALLGPEVPPGMNKGASGQITQSATPLPATTPVAPTKAPAKSATLKDVAKPTTTVPKVDLQKESLDRAMKALQDFNKGYKTSPLLKRDPAADAIESSGVDQAVMEALNEVHPAAGMAAAAALVAFGGMQAIPSLAKYMPKVLPKAGVVDHTGKVKGAVLHAGAKPSISNVRPAGANEGAHAAIVNGILNTAAKTKKAKMETLYQEFWKTQYKLGTPKTDLQWSNAIAEANGWVAERIKPSAFTTMPKGK